MSPAIVANCEGSFIVGEWSVEPELGRIIGYSKSIYLRSQVMELLVYLAKNQGQVVSLENLLDDLWMGKIVTAGTVYNCIAELRNALAVRSDQPVYIETIPKKGYRLVATVTGQEGRSNTNDVNEAPVSILSAESLSIRAKLVVSVLAIVGLLMVSMFLMLNRWSIDQLESPKS